MWLRQRREQRENGVKRPISWKIFGITGLLLLLMTLVTLISSINFAQVDRQIGMLSDYYIPLDQTLSDIRQHHAMQSMMLERALNAEPTLAWLPAARKSVQVAAAQLGNCEYEAYSTTSKKLREGIKDPAEQAQLSFELNRYCGERKTVLATTLVDKALTLPIVAEDPLQTGMYR